MIDFSTVSREFQGLVARRREQITFLGSAFAAMSLFLQNALQGNLPGSLGGIERHLFAFYAIMILVPSFVTALRMARLHAGMVLNGMLYARLLEHQSFTVAGNPARSSRHNFFGVSFLYFLLADLLAGFTAAILGLSVSAPVGLIAFMALSVPALGLAFYFRSHGQAVEAAWGKIRREEVGPVSRTEWEDHTSRSLEEANLGMLTDIAFVGLVLFAVFEVLSSLGRINPNQTTELEAGTIQTYGPLVFAVSLAVVGLFGLLTYIRVRVAVGRFSLMLDPNDRPFRPGKLTDSLLGYLLLAFLFTVSIHVLMVQVVPGSTGGERWLLGLDAAVFLLAVAAEQTTLALLGRKVHRELAAPAVVEAIPPDSPIQLPVQIEAEPSAEPGPGTPP